VGALLDLDPDALLTTTRVVRKRLDLTRPVELDVIRECLTIALQAPTGGNAQHWHWLVITDTEQRAAIGELYRRSVEQYAGSPASVAEQFAGDPERAAQQQRVAASTWHLGENMGRVPVLVIPCLKLPAGELPAGNQAWLWGSLLPAAWSYMLAARARGLGTAWTTLHFAYEEEIGALLGLPEDVRTGVLIPTAYSIGTDFKPARRMPLDSVLHLDRW
jgi:nitroreductase